MPPRSTDFSTLKILPPPHRSPSQTGEDWLHDKNLTDGAEGLWRIHDKLYDISEFIQNHPGGPEWLQLTKGTDITEAFEVHHLSTIPEQLIEKYFIRFAKTRRNSPFTFKENGFYRTLKRRVQKELDDLPRQPVQISAFFTDSMLVLMFLFAVFANYYWNYSLGICAGIMLGLLTSASHNYFHRKDNFRMLYFNFSLLQTRQWRISHVLSHHLHTNSIDDMEIIMCEPFYQYLPTEKTWITRFLPWVIFPFLWPISLHLQFFKRARRVAKGDFQILQWYDFIPFTLPLCMFLLGNKTFMESFWMWNFIVIVGSFFFFAVGSNAAHHHPDIFHDGDTPRPIDDYDWGLSQLDTVMDRKEITGSHFLVLTFFGDHALHHLFPTLDHGSLEFLYPVVKDVCKQFNADLRMTSQLEMIKGQFLQAARVQPNPNPPNLLKKYN